MDPQAPIPMTRPPRPPRDVVAHHEAGHVVVAHLTGFHVVDGDVTIDGDDRAMAPFIQDFLLLKLRMRDEGWSMPDKATVTRQECFVAAAGYAAEMVYAEKRGQPFNIAHAELGALGDRKVVRDLWGPRAFKAFADEVAITLKEPGVWQMVEEIAAGLIRTGVLSADELLGYLDPAMARLKVNFRLISTAHPDLQTPTPAAASPAAATPSPPASA